jgi:hypothetical protein
MMMRLVGTIVSLLALPGLALASQGGVKARLSGDDGVAFSGCKACFFDLRKGPSPSHGSAWWRIPDAEFDSLLSAEGYFETLVEESDYIVASVKRHPGNDRFGPPDEGEQVYLSERVRVKAGSMADLGKGHARAHVTAIDPGLARIEGILLDRQGQPFRGGFVVAFPGGYLSKKSKSNGRFTLYLPEGGEYRIIARDNYGGYT